MKRKSVKACSIRKVRKTNSWLLFSCSLALGLGLVVCGVNGKAHAADVLITTDMSTADIQTAITNANSEDIIVFLDDFTLDTSVNFISKTLTYTMDGTAHTLTLDNDVSLIVGNGGTLNIGETGNDAGLTITHADGATGSGIVGQWNGAVTVNDGTVITANTTDGRGGGILTDSGAITVTNAQITNNSANTGGAIAANANITVSGSTLSGNTSIEGGGAIEAAYAGGLTITVNNGTEISNNTAGGSGGGITAGYANTVDVDNAIFSNNSATGSGGAIYTDAGDITVNNGEFTDNTSVLNGGAIFSQAGSVTITGDDTVFTGNTVTGDGTAGGAVSLFGDYATFSMTGGEISGNTAVGNGGGVFVASGIATMENVNISGNTSGNAGGAVYGGQGGQMTITGGTFDNNSAAWAGAIYSNGDVTINGSAEGTSITNNTADSFGGAILVNTVSGDRTLTLNTDDGEIVISGNIQYANDAENEPEANGIFMFGAEDSGSAAVVIEGANTLTLGDGLQASLIGDTAKLTMTKDGAGTFNWGGDNIIDATDGAIIDLNEGIVNLADDFGIGNSSEVSTFAATTIEFNINDDVIVNAEGDTFFADTNINVDGGTFNTADESEMYLMGSAVNVIAGELNIGDNGSLVLDNSALAVTGGDLNLGANAVIENYGNSSVDGVDMIIGEGQSLTVDAGDSLTLGANSTLTFDQGTYNVGLEEGLAAGIIIAQNAAETVEFLNTNAINLEGWVNGTHTILTSDGGISLNTANLIYTVDGRELHQLMSIQTQLADDDETLNLILAATGTNEEKIWNGGTSGNWDYDTENWLLGDAGAAFIMTDAALFNGSGNHTVTITEDVMETGGVLVEGDGNWIFNGGALSIDSTYSPAPPDVDYVDEFVMNGTGVVTLNTGSDTNSNYINQISVNSGLLALGDGFTVEAANIDTGSLFVADGAGLELLGVATFNDYELIMSGGVVPMAAADDLVAGVASIFMENPASQMVLNNSNIYLGDANVNIDLDGRDTDNAFFVTDADSTVYLNNSTLVVNHSGAVAADAEWLVVDGNYNGVFGDVKFSRITLTGDAVYETDGVYLDAVYTPLTDDFAGFSSLSPNAQKAYPGLVDLITNGDSPFIEALNEYYGTADAFYADMANWANTMTGEAMLTQGMQALKTHQNTATIAMRYAFETCGASGGTFKVDDRSEWGFKLFAGYLGNFGNQSKHNGYGGYKSRYNGFLAGFSIDFSDSFTAGAYGGYSTGKTKYNSLDTKIDADTTHVGLFARFALAGFNITGDVTYSHTSNDSKRNVNTPFANARMKGDFDQDVYGVGLEAAWDWKITEDQKTVITPFVSLRWAKLDQDSFTESGDLGLHMRSVSADSLISNLGVKLARDFELGPNTMLTPKITAAWRHEFLDDYVKANSSFVGSPVVFSTRSIEQDRDGALLGASLDLSFKNDRGENSFGIKVAYGADLSSHYNEHTVYAGFEIGF